MATLSRPSVLMPGRNPHAKRRPPRTARPATTGDPTPTPSPYTRSALPLAISWFVLPALLLVLSLRFGWLQ